MAKYINQKTGVFFFTDLEIEGGDWVLADDDSVEAQEVTPEEIEEVTEEEPADEVDEDEEFEDEEPPLHLPNMTIAELKVFAEENDVIIPDNVTKKDDIIQVIAQAFEG